MNRSKMIAVGFFAIVFLLILGAILYIESINASSTIKVYQVTSGVTAGQFFSPSTVTQVTVKAQPGDFNYAESNPDGTSLIFATNLSKGDIVRPDDLLQANTKVTVQLPNVTNAGNINPGDLLNIYAVTADQTVVLIGPNVRVASVVNSTIGIQVDARNETAWVALASSKDYSLILAGSNGTSVAGAVPTITPAQALQLLSPGGGGTGTGTGGGGFGASPTPGATP